MDRRSFMKISSVIAAQAAMIPAMGAEANPDSVKAKTEAAKPVNPFEQEGRWYKAALHVHTTTSDGDVDVATRLGQYRKAGYDVVAITDHWKTNDLSGYSDDQFLAISGMEAHPQTGTGAPAHHFVCLNLPHPFTLARDLKAQALIDQVKAAGGTPIYAHPFWTAHTLDEMREVSGYIGMEVYNAVCDLHNNKGYSTVHWDQMLNKGFKLVGVVTDDVHKSHEINQGWTMIKTRSFDVAGILEALSQGCCYGSCGPVINDFRNEEGIIRIETSEVRQITFYYNGAAGAYFVKAKDGELLTKAQWAFGKNKRTYNWIRAEVIDEAGKCAWTNPIWI